MSFPILTAQNRILSGRKNREIREQGLVPGIIYGAGVEPQKIQLDRTEFVKLYSDAGESTVVDLQIDGKSQNVLMYDYQLDPLRDEVIHVDFRAIDMKKELETKVKILFVGESAAVKALGGTLIAPIDEISIRALPANLPKFIEVDLSVLETFQDAIRVADLQVPENVEVLLDEKRTIAVVSAPRTDAEMKALDEELEADVSGVEVDGEEKEGEGESGQEEGVSDDKNEKESNDKNKEEKKAQ